ncbi:MAG TPA: hypothetical protein VF187_06015 [Gemmatimonadales bacterium]
MMRIRTGMLAVLLPAVAAGQAVPAVRLGAATGRLEAEFTSISSVRELHDGRVILSDPRDRGLVLVDFRTGRVEAIGRKGQGPGEYGLAGPVRATRGDSSIMFDLTSRRWLMLDGPRIVATLSADVPAVAATQGLATGADSLGFVITVRSPRMPAGVIVYGKRDSTNVVRINRATGAETIIARTRQSPSRIETDQDARGRILSMRVRRPPLVVGEEALLFPDGWLAVARLEPYRVDWRTPRGQWRQGKALPVPVVRLDAREKRAYMERIAGAANQPPKSPDTVTDWPEEIAPFQPGSLLGADDGRLILFRQRTADHPESRYDIVDRQGRLQGLLTLPENERIVGFGRGTVYTALAEEDGIQRLVRYAWPAGR